MILSMTECKKKIHLTSRFWRHNSIRLWRGNERFPLPLFSPGLLFGREKIGLLLKIILFVIKFLLPAAERRYANATKKFNYFIATARVDTRTGVEESLRFLRDERARQCIPDILSQTFAFCFSTLTPDRMTDGTCDFVDTGCESASENVPLQGALTSAVRTSVGVTEISLTSSTTSKTNNEQVAQL